MWPVLDLEVSLDDICPSVVGDWGSWVVENVDELLVVGSPVHSVVGVYES